MPGNAAFPVPPALKVAARPDAAARVRRSTLRAWPQSFTIAHLSDIHCGDPHFVPDLMERAIADINDARAGHRRLLRRPDDLRLQGGVRAGEALPRPARRASRSSSSPGTTTRGTSATSTSRSCSATATRCCARSGVTVVAVDSTEPDLDHGQIGRGRYGWIEERVRASRPTCASSSCTTTCCRCPGTGPRAEHRLRRRRRDRVPAARRV